MRRSVAMIKSLGGRVAYSYQRTTDSVGSVSFFL
jgi:hypothetical protein